MKKLLLAFCGLACLTAGIATGAGINHLAEHDYRRGIFDTALGGATAILALAVNIKTDGFKLYDKDKEA